MEVKVPERYCPRCGTDVEDVGGFCLLGHSLKLQSLTQAPPPSPDGAGGVYQRLQTEPRPATVETAPLTAPPPPPPPPLVDFAEQTNTRIEKLWAGFEEEAPSAFDPITQFAPSTRMDWGPGESMLKRRGFRRS